ncbi:DUF4147 domain-containing protein (plasmid) [Deinococcus taeanensis]|uniref:glycerate kinase type-2 family protein n=1 Tax=Deinococcus taeanensis TaxID=2737050 RepID=UPI001CDC820F|nr:DUF4147 domain-containing protein [Deinococcus taeanensis]UBV44977.1 DUF4147 domain-containing protein [Deinococcus taeanensis]
MRELLSATFHAALTATRPGTLVAPHLNGPRPALILSVGKAGASMLSAALDRYPDTPAQLIVPRGAAGGPWPDTVDVHEAGHPHPDEHSEHAALSALARVGTLRESDTLLVLISGGGSALMSAPHGVTRPQKAALAAALMRAGADIHALNTVRRHLSAVKGGQLAQATRAHVQTLLLSDVVGDDPAVIASGPTVPDPTTFSDALAVLDRFGVPAPEARAYFQAGAAGAHPETPAALPHVVTTVVGGNRHLLRAAAAFLDAQGVRPVILGDTFTGEARELAAFHAALVRSVQAHGTPCAAPVALLSGGEATVTVRGAGRGGRNTEFALALALALGDGAGVHALSAGSDGADGTAGAAGALLSPGTLARARALGLSAPAALNHNDSAPFFAALGDLLVTGPTGQNLNDLRVVLVGP